jgi:hypothetical protein
MSLALHAWSYHNSLSLNPDKSDSVIFGTRQRSQSFSDVTMVNVAGSVVPMADHVKLLGVTLDNHLSMDKYVNEVSRAHVFTIYAHCDKFDLPSPPVTPILLPDPSRAHGSTTLSPCCMAYHRRTSIVFKASKMRWLDASWTLKFIGVQMRFYNKYTSCLSISVLTSNLRSLRSLLAQLPPVRT